jgi:hypothetical protein
VNQDGLNHGWRCAQLAPIGVLEHDALGARWIVTPGLLYVGDRLAPRAPRDMDDASEIAVEMVEGRIAYEDACAAYEQHEREIREHEQDERRRRGELPAVDRAARYLEKMAPSVGGAAGAGALFTAAQVLAKGFDLPDSDALPLLRAYDQRSAPPWSERELVRVLRSARRRGRMAHGALLGAHRGRSV